MSKAEHRDALLRFREALLDFQATGSRRDRERVRKLQDLAREAAKVAGVTRQVGVKVAGPYQPLPVDPIANALLDNTDESGKAVATHALEVVEEALRALGSEGDAKPSQQDTRQPDAGKPMDASIDFAILTAIEVERRAVCAAFGLGDDHRVRQEARVYWRGRLPLKNGESYQIVVAQAPDAANVDAALLAYDMINHWKPGAALLLGIAGSAHKDIRLGDVVVGSDVYYYERGKVTPEGTLPEPKIIPADSTLWSNVSAVPDWDGNVFVERPDRAVDWPKVHYGVIASGEKVIADAVRRGEIVSEHRKILAIEMEGYGFSRAVWQSFQHVRHLDIRGISDDADTAKNDNWHKYAAAAVAGFAKHFLLDRPLESRPQ